MKEALEKLRQDYQGEEFDYSLLLSYLKGYSKPRDKISRYLKDGSIIRVKKGLYVFGNRYRRDLVSLEVLANLIYGPSYVSLEYALSYYGMIPEKVSRVTSVTTQRKKLFYTPVGIFSYRPIPLALYAVGIKQHSVDKDRHFLMASKEKALIDKLVQESFKDTSELYEYLIDNLRINPHHLWKLSLSHIHSIMKAYPHPSIHLLNTLIKEKQ